MPKLDVKSIDGQVVGQVELSADVFEVTYNPYIIQEIVRMQLANRRRGTHKTKGRSEVAYSTKKLYRQKGTGHARSGDRKSPLRRGGGTIFGPIPRDYSFYPPKKVRKGALKVALSQKLREGQIEIYREYEPEFPKTKTLLKQIASNQEATSTLIIWNDEKVNFMKSLRNIPNFKMLRVDGLNVYDLVLHKRIILMENSISSIHERLIG